MPLTTEQESRWAGEAKILHQVQILSLTHKQGYEQGVHILDQFLLKYTRMGGSPISDWIEDWTAAMVKSGLLVYVPESVFKAVAPHMGMDIADDTVCSYLGKAAVLTKDGVALAMIFRDMDRNSLTTDRERDLRRYSAEQAKPLTAFFGRPVHALTLDEIETFKTLAESVTVSETKDGFAVEIANVDLDRHIHETGTPVTLAGVEFMHRT